MQSYYEGGQPDLEALLRQLVSKAKPGDKRGGKLDGKQDQLQKLPNGKMQAHGGEYVVNAKATDAYGPLLEALNRSVPAKPKNKRMGGTKYEKPKTGKSFWGGGETGQGDTGDPGASPGDPGAGVGEGGGVGTGTAGPGATTGGIGIGGGPAGAGTSVDTGAPPAGPGASTAGGVTAGTSGSGGVGLGPGVVGPGVSPAIGVPADTVSLTPDAVAAGLTPADFGLGAATAAEDDIGATAFGLANMTPATLTPSDARSLTVSDAAKGFVHSLPGAKSLAFGPNSIDNSRAGNILGNVASVAASMVPFGGLAGLVGRGAVGANDAQVNAIASMLGIPAADVASSIAAADAPAAAATAASGNAAGGPDNALAAELAALEEMMPEVQRRSDRAAGGRTPMEDAMASLSSRGMDISRNNPWALAEAARPFAGNTSMDNLLAQARKFFSV